MRQASDKAQDRTGDAGQDAQDLRIAVLATRFNQELVDQLVQDARTTLLELGTKEADIVEFRVPGSLELPTAARWISESEEFDGVVALGIVIRGETPHFDYVCQGAVHGLTRVSIDTGVPIMFGVLTTDNLEQALERIYGPVERKGTDVALGVVEMIRLRQSIAANK